MRMVGGSVKQQLSFPGEGRGAWLGQVQAGECHSESLFPPSTLERVLNMCSQHPKRENSSILLQVILVLLAHAQKTLAEQHPSKGLCSQFLSHRNQSLGEASEPDPGPEWAQQGGNSSHMQRPRDPLTSPGAAAGRTRMVKKTHKAL